MINFAYNYINNMRELENILLSPHIEKCKEGLSYSVKQHPNRLEKRYYIDDNDDECAKVVYSSRGVHFYNRKNNYE